jgi:hypothetical protein
MKIKYLLIPILFIVFSCSKNDDPAPIPPPTTVTPPTVGDDVVTNYVNLAFLNYWQYEANSTRIVDNAPATVPISTTETITSGYDNLNAGNDVVLNTFTYKNMTTSLNNYGFYCSMLKDNNLRVDGSSVKMTGKFRFDLGGNVLEFPVADFVIFKENALINTELGMPATGTTTFPVTVATLTLPITVNYKVKAIAGGDSADIVYNSTTYTNIKKITLYITLDANITAPGSSTITQVLDPINQDVIVSTQYYSKNIGLVKADTNISYKFSSAITNVAPTLPAKATQTVMDKLFSRNF